MSDPYRTPAPKFAEGDLVVVASEVAHVVGHSQARPNGWLVRWPNGLLTTELEETLMRVFAPNESEENP